ncbi:hypothetical protein MIMGU_mgv1a020705mg [Erythranthe guttata]|uniref:Uncharacterized protein n=1 Tax=Erythranthe guttata TaxID=4155 RepID=A0A022REU3_ERYGU|nr:hypothetical protein MIMGU_mgv1a020705mg [Erythranthe guttata]
MGEHNAYVPLINYLLMNFDWRDTALKDQLSEALYGSYSPENARFLKAYYKGSRSCRILDNELLGECGES